MIHRQQRNLRKKKYRIRWRRIILFFCCVIGFFCGIYITFNTSFSLHRGTLAKYHIVIDAGHGGSDCGTIGVETGVYEKDINLAIATKLQAELEKLGAKITMTRTEKTTKALGNTKKLSIEERGRIIEAIQPDMTLSIHQNFNEDSNKIRGTQILCNGSTSVMLASTLQATFNSELNTDLNYLQNDYKILKFGNHPSVIVECGFLSNKNDEKLLQTSKYQKRIVEVLVKEVENYLLNQEI